MYSFVYNAKKVIEYLATRLGNSSITSQILLLRKVDREKIRAILKFIADKRKLQTAFASIIGATRFKQILQNKLTITACPKCGIEIDSWAHLTQCYKLIMPIAKEKEKIWLEEVREYLETIQAQEDLKDRMTMPTICDKRD